ncbi:MAG: alpha-hydroxyketone-type quorum-sensing autoinducer synthase [Polyangiaceae bacterium]
MSRSDSIGRAPGVRSPKLPPLLEARVDPARVLQIDDLVKGSGPLAPGAVRLFSNDYLSLANHPQIVEAIMAARASTLDSLWMSAVFFEEGSVQRRLERLFAEFLGTEDCVLTQSGYCANLGLLQSIAGPGTNVYIDACAHASLWHGLLASRATPRRFAHNDPSSLEQRIRETGPGIVIVDSLYSHNGAVCPLADMVSVARCFDCVVVVDESHSLGVYGPSGAGMIAELGLEGDVHFRTASLAKAFVSRAGLVAGAASTCRMMRYTAGPAIFSSACMEHDLAGLECALGLIVAADDRRQRLQERATELRTRLEELGYAIASRSHVVALESGLESETVLLRRFLESRGVYGSVFCAPATRIDESLVRLSVHASLTSEELDQVVSVCRDAQAHVDFDSWASTRRRRGEPAGAGQS